jgi:serine protease inhibitor
MQHPVLAFVAAGLLVTLAALPSQAKTAGDSSAATAPAANLLEAQATLGMGLLQRMAGEDSSLRTLVIAPASLASALAFLDLGADAAMDRAIVKTLGFAPGDGQAAMQSLRAAAKDLAGTPSGQGPLAFGNAIFVDPAGGIEPAAIAKLEAAGVTARTAALGEAAGIAAVNDWVSGQTAGLIPTILSDPIPNAALVALNALHFKDKWYQPFPARLTSPQPFHLVGGKTADVAMMRLSADLASRQDDRFVAIALPYETEGYSLVVVTTKAEPAAVADFAPVAAWLTGKDFQKAAVELSLPKFGATATNRLLPHLDRLGLAEGYSPTAFNGLSAKPLPITDVVQKTVIKVDEEGTEAAAGTAVTMSRGMRVDTLGVVVDKPFIFALRDDKRGLILLAGYVGDPTGQ